MKILNLYAGLGGNRKFWDNCDVVAVESVENIAKEYQMNYPDDEVIVDDAHEYLLNNYQEFDFIWSSPPCQSHSRMMLSGKNRPPRYPDLKLYEEILFLKHNFNGFWVVENVVPFYEPLIVAQKIGRHLFWSNFHITKIAEEKIGNFILTTDMAGREKMQEWLGISTSVPIYYPGNHCPTQVLRNCVHPDLGKHVYECAVKPDYKHRLIQKELF